MKKIIRSIKDNKGLVIIEATIVFPVMFLVLFFIILIGNVYYEMAQVEDIVLRASIKGSQRVIDPLHYEMETNKKIPVGKEVNIQPYRYLFGKIKPGGSIVKIENVIKEETEKSFEKVGTFFTNMKPYITRGPNVKFNNYLIYATFEVEIEYEIPFPLKYFGDDIFQLVKLSARSEVSVNDMDEFIRNTDMIIDLVQGTKVEGYVKSIFNNINTFIRKFNSQE